LQILYYVKVIPAAIKRNFPLKASKYYLRNILETITDENALVLQCVTTNFNSKTFITLETVKTLYYSTGD